MVHRLKKFVQENLRKAIYRIFLQNKKTPQTSKKFIVDLRAEIKTPGVLNSGGFYNF